MGIDNEEFSAIFEREVEELTERANTMGIEQLLLERAEKQGEKKGALKERARIERLLAEERAKAEAERVKAEAEKRSAALKMKDSGFSNEMISDILGLSDDEIGKL
ncbi:hypothetical protein [Pararcticibacter amylolyticus]|uniref:Uncharacterized protein n=1 Tax=Pararcticibacter amylolyticus TaxID=2173175 RepID=A0A2U2PFL2_9SPHI|nr:hypothetical protein [Pararcticibacter amylolyticus]PWG80195.1 hypothetical protein DDR33_13460 [Pararcticibacter amylolyticus]